MLTHHRHQSKAFTLMDIMITVVILGITAALASGVIAHTEANQRADHAARETLIALRYARTLALSTGNPSGVEFDTTQKLIRVYTMLPPTPTKTWVTSPLDGGRNGGYFEIDLVNNREVANVTMTVNIATDTTNPYNCLFDARGSTKNIGTIVFNVGTGKRTLTLSALADPTLN